MPRMTPSKVKNVRIPAEVEAAIMEWCAEQKTTLSSLLLQAALEKIGRADLLEHVRPRGRPKSDEPPTPRRGKGS